MEFSVEYRVTGGSLSFVSLYVPLGAWVDTGNRIRHSLFWSPTTAAKKSQRETTAERHHSFFALYRAYVRATTYSNNYCAFQCKHLFNWRHITPRLNKTKRKIPSGSSKGYSNRQRRSARVVCCFSDLFNCNCPTTFKYGKPSS